MNNKLLIGIAVVILLIGVGVYAMSSKTKPATVQNGNNATETTEDSGPQTLKSLLSAGVPQKCTFSDVSGQTDVAGTTYISGGKVRGDFSTTVEGEATTGHTIFDGTISYVWMDGNSTGLKMEIDPTSLEETADDSDSATQQGLDLNKETDYSCGPWIPETSMFTPPTNVTFTEFSIPATNPEITVTQNQNLCASCNSLTGDQKTQCLTALNCN